MLDGAEPALSHLVGKGIFGILFKESMTERIGNFNRLGKIDSSFHAFGIAFCRGEADLDSVPPTVALARSNFRSPKRTPNDPLDHRRQQPRIPAYPASSA
jgi:hypothetical protein